MVLTRVRDCTYPDFPTSRRLVPVRTGGQRQCLVGGTVSTFSESQVGHRLKHGTRQLGPILAPAICLVSSRSAVMNRALTLQNMFFFSANNLRMIRDTFLILLWLSAQGLYL